jgi:hypothetical protein
LETNPTSRADEFRKNADESRHQAVRSRGNLDKERCLKIAEHWLPISQEGDGNPNTGSGR